MGKRINIKNRERVLQIEKGLGISDISDNWLFKIIALAVSVVIFYSVFNSVKLTIQKLDVLKQARQEVEDLRLENLHLSIGIKDMSTDKYLEKEARDRLNFGGVNEIVFVIPTNALDIAQGRVDEIINPKVENVYEEGNNMDKWVSFVISGV